MAKKDFFIPQVEDDEQEKKTKEVEPKVETSKVEKSKQEDTYESEGFISTIYGRNVKNAGYYPGVEPNSNRTRRYETLKENRKDYAEFEQYIINKKPNVPNQNNNNNVNNSNNQETYQEVIVNQHVEEVDPYANEPVVQDEFVSVKQPINTNTYNNSNNYNKYLFTSKYFHVSPQKLNSSTY